VSLMWPIFASMTVFLESLGRLLFFAIYGSILSVGSSRKCACVSKIPDRFW